MMIRRMDHGFRLLAACGLMLASQALHALGLGDARVYSYLGQPLEVRIDLISQTEEELATVTAGLASADDFRLIGLDRAAISVPLDFQLNRGHPGAHIRVTSTLPVNEPVVQLVLEITFASGRMLREYTLFLDPPTVPSVAPAPRVTPRVPEPEAAAPSAATTPELADEPIATSVLPAEREPAPVRRPAAPVAEPEVFPEAPEPVAEPADMTEASDAATAAETQRVETAAETAADARLDGAPELTAEPGIPADAEPPAATLPEPEPTAETVLPEEEPVPQPEPEAQVETEPAPAADEEPAPRPEPLSESTEETEPALVEDEEPAPPPEPLSESAAELEPVLEAEPEPTPEVTWRSPDAAPDYGPVQRGETLWGIASRYVAGTDFSVNQAMLAIQRQNPRAFARNNINALRSGAILRMPDFAQMAALSAREAMLEAMSQEDAYRAMKAGLEYDASPPTVAEQSLAAVSDPEPVVDETPAADASLDALMGRLELVPPAADTATAEPGDGAAAGQAGQTETEPDAAAQLARMQEELANAQQENAYLSERIRELESELAASGREGTVGDAGLAQLESRLREDRLDTAEESPLTVVPPADDEAWYRGKTWWVLGLVVLVLGTLVWLLKRLAGPGAPGNPPETPDDGRETVDTITDEAEEILRVLEPEENAPASEGSNVVELGSWAEPEHQAEPAEEHAPDTRDEVPDSLVPEETEPADDAPEPTAGDGTDQALGQDTDADQAVELDAEDPETKLDLARAYISMGDKDAARAMLNDVIVEGTPEQAAEAKGMMREL